VGLHDEEAYFSNVRITPAAPESLANGSDIAGSWEMRYSSDAGGMSAVMEVHRQGAQVTGTWSGPLGEGRVLNGTWRNGYVELSFAGEWPKESRQGAPGPVRAFLAGWIDGDSGKGRMRVEGAIRWCVGGEAEVVTGARATLRRDGSSWRRHKPPRRD
jgi:hypothetical protein